MSATPETDAAQHEGLLRTNPIPLQVVTAEFARKLERERDEWEETARVYCQNSDFHREMREKAERERDEARAERDILRSNKMSDPLLETTFKHLNRERDEACEVANGLAKQVERLCKECDEARQQLRIAVGLLSTQPQFANKHPEDVLAFVKEVAK